MLALLRSLVQFLVWQTKIPPAEQSSQKKKKGKKTFFSYVSNTINVFSDISALESIMYFAAHFYHFF